MPKQSNNKLVLGGAAGLVIVAAVWFFMRSESAVETRNPTPQPMLTMTEDEPVARSEPRGSTGRARLGGPGTASVEDEDQEGVTQKSKTKRSKKRQRRKQEREEEEEKETGAKKGKKQKFYGK